MKNKAVIYLRVSKSDNSQDSQNQKTPLLKWAESLGLNTIHVYEDMMTGGAANRPQFQQMMKDARLHKFDIILDWSLDRFSREGIRSTLSYLERLKHYNIGLKSLQESWLDTTDEGMGQLLISIFSWVAEQERQKISKRTKAGLVRVKDGGKKLGRPKGSGDKKPRKKSGYYLRWQK